MSWYHWETKQVSWLICAAAFPFAVASSETTTGKAWISISFTTSVRANSDGENLGNILQTTLGLLFSQSYECSEEVKAVTLELQPIRSGLVVFCRQQWMKGFVLFHCGYVSSSTHMFPLALSSLQNFSLLKTNICKVPNFKFQISFYMQMMNRMCFSTIYLLLL